MIALLEFWELDRGSIQEETLAVTMHLFITRERIGETPHIYLCYAKVWASRERLQSRQRSGNDFHSSIKLAMFGDSENRPRSLNSLEETF